jgi:cytochrome bd ubiquinol oxidase subunit II
VNLQNFWFVLIGVLWAGYFVLEGFDFGVGMLLPWVPRDERERGVLLESIGPVWDGNEVWLVVAGGATFAAFPAWYATLFSGFYIALLLVLFFLIIRVVSFEWREKSESPRWQAIWAGANTLGSFGAPLIWGIAFANLLQGVPLNSSHDYAGNFWDLFSVYTVLGGLAVVALFAFHGAGYLTLRLTGDLCQRAAHAKWRLAPAAAVLGAAFLIWTVKVAVDNNDKPVLTPAIPAAAAIIALVLAIVLSLRHRRAWAFGLTATTIALVVATIFAGLYPRVMVSSPTFSNSLTIANSASAHYTLLVMTVVAIIITPVVLVYQGWTYYVFRARVTGEEVASPVEALTQRPSGAPGA